MKLCIKNGRVLDPASGLDKTACVNIEDGIIKSIGEAETADETIDAAGKLVLPGLIDLHVHFREPGREDQETIAGGCRIAAKSGYTSVVTMPNTNPPIDNQALVKFIKHEAEKSGLLNIFPAAAVSKGMKGEEISEMGELHTAGAVAFTDDGKPVSSSILMRRALEYSRMCDVPIMAHEEDHLLVDSGVINEGKVSASLGLRGIPNAAEEVMIARDVIIAELSKGRLHVQHISSGGSVEIIRNAKKRGVKVTCETAPHYFSLTDEVVRDKLALAKMNPPLRTEDDRMKIIEGLKDGTIDAIATDHAPHLMNEKRQEIEFAPNGIIGLETAVPLMITKLVKENGFSYNDVFAKVTCNPAKIINIKRGEIKPGYDADIVIIDPEKKVIINEDFIASNCKNTPFMGAELFGSVACTILSGRITYKA